MQYVYCIATAAFEGGAGALGGLRGAIAGAGGGRVEAPAAARGPISAAGLEEALKGELGRLSARLQGLRRNGAGPGARGAQPVGRECPP